MRVARWGAAPQNQNPAGHKKSRESADNGQFRGSPWVKFDRPANPEGLHGWAMAL
jgi:hypothetical protein